MNVKVGNPGNEGQIEALVELREAFDRRLGDGGERRRRRRRIALLAATVLAVPAAVAGAVQLTGGVSDEPVVIAPGERVLVGFQNPATGEPIVCPGGAVLSKWVGDGADDDPPRCSDGSTPDEYTRLIDQHRRDWERFFEEAPALTPLADGPGFMTFEIERSEDSTP